MRGSKMKRRDFMTLLGGAAAWPRLAHAQTPPLIGFLSPTTSVALAPLLPAFHSGLSDAGYVEGRSVAIEYRWADDHFERLPELAADLAARRVAVLTTVLATAGAIAAKSATTEIPIVFAIGADPVKFGLVSSIARPTGNITGVSFLGNILVAKQVQLLHELMPAAKRIGVLANPGNPNAKHDTDEVIAAARLLGVDVSIADAALETDFAPAFERFGQARVEALLILPDALFLARADQVAAFATRRGLPTIFSRREAAAAGCLMSYGSNLQDVLRQTGVYTGRILKGAKPADLPVVQSSRFELVINLKIAKVLGIAVPPTLLARADEVIE